MSDTEDIIKFAIIGTWLVEVLDRCTCGTGGTLYPHEQYCGCEPVVDLSTLEGFKKLKHSNECAECDRLSAAVRRVRELHRESNGSLSALYPDPICECGKDYPCPTLRILDEPARLHNERDRL